MSILVSHHPYTSVPFPIFYVKNEIVSYDTFSPYIHAIIEENLVNDERIRDGASGIFKSF